MLRANRRSIGIGVHERTAQGHHARATNFETNDVPAGNRLDVSAYRCVGVAARNRQNQLRPSSLLRPVVTRGPSDNIQVSLRSCASERTANVWFPSKVRLPQVSAHSLGRLIDVVAPEQIIQAADAEPPVAIGFDQQAVLPARRPGCGPRTTG